LYYHIGIIGDYIITIMKVVGVVLELSGLILLQKYESCWVRIEEIIPKEKH